MPNPIQDSIDPDSILHPGRKNRVAQSSNQITGSRRWWALGAVLLTMFFSSLDQTVIATAMPVITGDLQGFTLRLPVLDRLAGVNELLFVEDLDENVGYQIAALVGKHRLVARDRELSLIVGYRFAEQVVDTGVAVPAFYP